MSSPQTRASRAIAPRGAAVLALSLLFASSLLGWAAHAAEPCVPASVVATVAGCAGASPPSARTGEALHADLVAAVAAQGRPPAPGSTRTSRARRTFAPQPIAPTEQALLDEAQAFLCADRPAPGDTRAALLHGEITFQRGRLFFAHNHWEEATILFRDLALHHASEPVGIYAQTFYLEALNVLGSSLEPARPACYDDMARDVPTLLGLHCPSPTPKENEERCDVLRSIHRDIVRLDAEALVKEGDRGASPNAYERAGAMYLKLWEEQGKAVCQAKQNACGRMDEVLANAARAFQAAHLTERAIETRRLLIDPRYNLSNTALAKRARYELGVTFQSLARYDEAASEYEAFAVESPREEKAPDALTDALVLRLALGQLERADADASHFLKLYGTKLPARAAQVSFVMGAHLGEHGDLQGAKKLLAGAMKSIDANATIDVRIRTHAALGRALHGLRDEKAAATEYDAVRALHAAHRAKAFASDEADEGQKMRALAAALVATGEAVFFAAEQKRLAQRPPRPPSLARAAKLDDIEPFARGPLAAWVSERRRALDELERAYAELLAIEPVPPPIWVVRAAERVARASFALADDITALPAPGSSPAPGASAPSRPSTALQQAWAAALERASAPELSRARALAQRCVDLAAKYQAGEIESAACATALSKHFPSRFPRLDELVDRPTHLYAGITYVPVAAP
jgi:tetratricopeptide (TPR) repeat protein